MNSAHGGGADGRGVSEVVGFVLAFAVILTSVAIVYTAGFGTLVDIRETEQVRGAERAFDALDGNVEDLRSGRAPAVGGTIDLADGNLSLAAGSELRVEVVAAGVDTTLPTRALAYRNGRSRVDYENGVVFRSDPGGTVARDGPPLRCAPDAAVVSVLTLRQDRGGTYAGDTRLQVTVHRNRTRLVYPRTRAPGPTTDVNVTVQSRNGEAWRRLLETESAWRDPDDDGTFTCPDVSEVYVRQVVVDVRFDT
jgi:hypothetical protein